MIRSKPSRTGSSCAGVILVILLLASISCLAAWSLLGQQGWSAKKALSTQPAPANCRLIAKALDPEVMSHALPAGLEFDPAFKNPCWKTEDKVLHCLPYVYIGGSFQSGAASLFSKLSEHPDVITNDVSRWQFWAENVKPMQEYVAKHSGRPLQDLTKAPASKVILDGSASTFAFYWSAGLRAHQAFQSLMVPCWNTCSEASKGNITRRSQCMADVCHPKALAADAEVAKGLGVPYDTLHLPVIVSAAYGGNHSSKPKFIILLRNPLERIHAAYFEYAHYNGKYGNHAQGFLAYVKEQVGAMMACATRFIGQPGGPSGGPMTRMQAMRHCALYFEALGPAEEQVFFHADQFQRGMYAIFLEVWLRHFPRDSFLLLHAERYFSNPDTTMKQVFSFLGMPVPDAEVLQAIAKAGPAKHHKPRPLMLPEARQILLEFYQPWTKELVELLGDPSWRDHNTYPPKV